MRTIFILFTFKLANGYDCKKPWKTDPGELSGDHPKGRIFKLEILANRITDIQMRRLD